MSIIDLLKGFYMKIAVVGSGRWGTFIAWYLSRKFDNVCLFGRETSQKFKTLCETRQNEYVKLSEKVALSSDFSKLSEFDLIIISISSQSLRQFLTTLDKTVLETKKIILCMKGVEVETGDRLTEVAISCGVEKNNVAVWLGPGHIQEFVSGKPNCMVIDSYNPTLTKYLADTLKSDLIRFYYGEDVIGNEMGAAAKNVLGIVAGILDGADLSTLKGPLMARGAREVARLIKAMGGNELSAYGLCHLGDYETTLFSPYSNNRRYGEAFIKGEKFDKLAEGVMTTKALKNLSQKYNVEMPIISATYAILFENKDAVGELNKLFNRSFTKEFL